MQDASAKQLVSEKVKNATNILVTVSADPSVDELSAALGLTLLLNKMDKHATAVFSGAIPPAITFLDPEKTFENTVDSLRDFIIALDKEKADRLRYKVEDDVVRIFITPYRTTITEKDLDFSQGDFNVELIIALGVEKREDLDKAIQAHGRILHDATVVTVNAGNGKSSLGAIDWQDSSASSLCEMLVSVSESFGSGLLDQQMANAFLTGIVAATDRFSNAQTSPKVMTLSAQLMAAGANQQLIATKLTEARAIGSAANEEAADDKKSVKLKKSDNGNESNGEDEAQKTKNDDGVMQIEHDKAQEKAEAAADSAEKKAKQRQSKAAKSQSSKNASQNTNDSDAPADKNDQAAADKAPDTPTPEDEVAATEKLSEELAESSASAGQALPSVADLQADIAKQSEEVENAASEVPAVAPDKVSGHKERRIEPPTLGGSLTATSEQALQDKLRAEDEDKNRTILSHDHVTPAEAPPSTAPFNSFSGTPESEQSVDPLTDGSTAPNGQPDGDSLPKLDTNAAPKTLAELEADARQHADVVPDTTPIAPAPATLPTPAEPAATPALDQARDQVNDAFNAAPFSAANNPTIGVGASPLGAALHDQPAELAPPPPAQPDFVLPPMPDMSTLPPLPDGTPPPPMPTTSNQVPPAPTPVPQTTPTPAAPAPNAQPQSNDPGQFQIPGQQ